MTQPTWKLLANLGDQSLSHGNVDHGGYLIYVDETGAYPPEGEYVEAPDDDDSGERYLAYRFALDRCTMTNGVLSDNPSHPEVAAWFADDLAQVAESAGLEWMTLRNWLCDEAILDRARAYDAIGSYHGFENLDDCPLTLTRAEADERYGGIRL
jgi:hypothetical protein